MSTLREAAQQALEALKSCSAVPHWPALQPTITDLRKALAQPEPRNQCGETCERAKLCAVCARGLDGAAQTPCDIAEDGVCEVIDCCRKSPLILEALEIGYDSAQAEAAQYHAAMAGYRPERHAEMDADVAKIAKAISAVKAVTAQEAETTRAQRMRDEGYTRRPTLREMAQEEQEPTVRIKCTVVDNQHPNGIPFEQWVNAPQQEQKPVVYTGDVARTMLESGMTFHLGMPHAIVMEQVTRFHDLVCAEASIKAAAAFAAPPRREWQSLSDKEISAMFPAHLRGDYKDLIPYSFARAVEKALKEKNNG